MSSSRLAAWLNNAAVLSVTLACASIIWLVISVHPALRKSQPIAAAASKAEKPGSPPLPSRPLSLQGAAIKGSTKARVGVVAYSDFQCPYCAKFARETLPQVLKEYVDSGKAFFAFRHLPLDSVHLHAFRAAEASECGRRQDMFWEVHDFLFANPTRLDSLSAHTFRKVRGLDLSSLASCLDGQAANTVTADATEARRVGITGTPTFLFGTTTDQGELKVTRREAGAISYRAFSAILDETRAALAATQGSSGGK